MLYKHTDGKLNLPQETSLSYYGESVPPQHPWHAEY